MKTIYSCLFILIFFISCDSDSVTKSQDTINRSVSNRNVTQLPGSIENPYDEVGWVHNELFETYYASGRNPTTIAGIAARVEAIADTTASFKAIRTGTYHPVSVARVQYILDHKNTCVNDVISTSSLSSDAKCSFISFINSFLSTFETESSCIVVYNCVVAYENSVLNATNLTTRDKQVLLTATAVIRHTAYLAKKKPKKNTDPDWTVLVGHVVAAADGSDYGMAESLMEALVAGIAQN